MIALPLGVELTGPGVVKDEAARLVDLSGGPSLGPKRDELFLSLSEDESVGMVEGKEETVNGLEPQVSERPRTDRAVGRDVAAITSDSPFEADPGARNGATREAKGFC